VAAAGISPGSIEERNRWMLRARDAIDHDYAQPLNIPALARIALVSEAHFIRTFRDTFGETPHRYLQRRRVERAMALLRGTDRSVTDICLAVGFWAGLRGRGARTQLPDSAHMAGRVCRVRGVCAGRIGSGP
jgi:AraC-like DNA-binding protein